MDAFVCLTDRDEENVHLPLRPAQRRKKVITKVNYIHQNMVKSLGLGLSSIITPQNITANIVVRYVDGLNGVIGSNIRTMHQIYSGDDGAVDAVEFQLNKRQSASAFL